ncbi:hypothetical protein [Fodinicola acaciae]|uniref:hypothetical protein n=1 Tax=Fodinicola acaciae TaxID=2681555 RepID=UPI001FE2EE02|nr:hypothetical protein [Fodinicola acaciae]
MIANPTGRRLLSAAVAGICALSANAAMAAPAHAAGHGAYCSVTIAPIKAGEAASRVRSYVCADSPGRLRAAAADGGKTLIMTLYNQVNYGPGSTEIRADGGPCDSTGYGIASIGWPWNEVISSFRVWNNCHTTEAYSSDNYGGTSKMYFGDVPNVGPDMNDKIHSFRIYAA